MIVQSTMYSRQGFIKTAQAAGVITQVRQCVASARSRTPAINKIIGCFGLVRTATLATDVLSEPIKFINIADKFHPFLGIDPEFTIEPNDGKKAEDTFSYCFKSYPFNEQEMDVLNRNLPQLEPYLSDTSFICRPKFDLVPERNWADGMRPADFMAYVHLYYEMIIEEIGRLALNDNDLVCDPACGEGRLLYETSLAFPNLKLTGSDMHLALIKKARAQNPKVELRKTKAQDLSYLDLGAVSLFILSGLLNNSVVSVEAAKAIIEQIKKYARSSAYVVITGKTLPLFNSDELISMGLQPIIATKWREFAFNPFYLCNI